MPEILYYATLYTTLETSDDNPPTDPHTGRMSIAISVLRAKITETYTVGEAPITEE